MCILQSAGRAVNKLMGRSEFWANTPLQRGIDTPLEYWRARTRGTVFGLRTLYDYPTAGGLVDDLTE